ncbi:MAG: proliferating cell nuclear antigen (pcna) [Candidatus Lokiarchaeota archaeon]|nr:proliferating cell nuclear antigen (pcna) [Candidatus Lokiarchaeota archaeon]
MAKTEEIEDLEELEQDLDDEDEIVIEEPKFKEEEATFHLKLDHSKIFRAIIETLASIIDETEIRVNSNELSITAMDPSRICLLTLTIARSNFDEFEYSGEGVTKIGLNLDDLEKIMKRASSNDSLELNYTSGDNKIKIIMKQDGLELTRSFSLAMLDIDIGEIPMDNLIAIDYPSSWVIDTDFFIDAIKDAEIYSEVLNIKTEANIGLTFSSEGQIGEMIYELGLEDFIDAEIETTETGAYSLTFLRAIMKIKSITEKLKVSLKEDHPLKLRFDLLEGGDLLYYLAPRVEQTDFDDEDMEEF